MTLYKQGEVPRVSDLHDISRDTLEGGIHGFAIHQYLSLQALQINPACQSIQKCGLG